MVETTRARNINAAGVSWCETAEGVEYNVNYTSMTYEDQFGPWSALPRPTEPPVRFFIKMVAFAQPHTTKAGALREMLVRTMPVRDDKGELVPGADPVSVWDTNETNTIKAALEQVTKPPPEPKRGKRRGVLSVATGTTIDIHQPGLSPKDATKYLEQHTAQRQAEKDEIEETRKAAAERAAKKATDDAAKKAAEETAKKAADEKKSSATHTPPKTPPKK